jgi:hypothetical protein
VLKSRPLLLTAEAAILYRPRHATLSTPSRHFIDPVTPLYRPRHAIARALRFKNLCLLLFFLCRVALVFAGPALMAGPTARLLNTDN